jgi:hypothetical protein
MAKLSHYVSGNLYYTVELADGVYQFPIATVEIGNCGIPSARVLTHTHFW